MPKQTSFKIEWDAHEYEHKERGQDWFWTVGIIAFAIAITSVILGNIIFGILILTAVFSLALFINRPPETTHVIIDEKGVVRGNIRYPYSTLKSFWIDEDHPHQKILLRSEKMLMPLIVIPLSHEIDTEQIENTLSQFIEKEPLALPLVETLLEYVGF